MVVRKFYKQRQIIMRKFHVIQGILKVFSEQMGFIGITSLLFFFKSNMSDKPIIFNVYVYWLCFVFNFSCFAVFPSVFALLHYKRFLNRANRAVLNSVLCKMSLNGD